ncbi:MAG: fatty acid hydroxylase family protein [Burkholderiales bacterium]|nr:fatty acid hydroxylase family protein [Burkholderiales bacterium]
MMTDRQRRFREQYVAQISPWYNGLLHVGVMYAAGISAIVWCVSRMQGATWEWLLILPVAIAGNFVEWGMHKFVMHRLIDVFALRAIYDRHTRQHHQYFTDGDPTIHTVKEFRIVFFPWRVLMVLAVAGGGLGWLAAQFLGPNAGYVVFITMIGHYMVYETFHFCCHVPENSVVRNLPLVNTIRRHHAAHHNMGIMMHCNMNLTFPLADWAMKTSDLKRGLLGHLFNGYDESYVKEELKPVMARFRSAETQEKRVTLDGPKLEADELRALQQAGSHA